MANKNKLGSDKFFILGENSFVGKALFDHIHKKVDCVLVPKQKINFLDSQTFQNINFDNSTIIDFININNGNKEDIMNCNYWGFTYFCEYLKKNVVNFTYIYISTVSVLSETAVDTNAYVNSKKMAEDYLISSGINYQILRLSYPIGKNENSKRLITRIINDLKNNKPVIVNNILINLNDVKDVVKEIFSVLKKNKICFISNNNYVYLGDITLFLKEAIQSFSSIEIRETTEQFKPMSDSPFLPSKDINTTLLEML